MRRTAVILSLATLTVLAATPVARAAGQKLVRTSAALTYFQAPQGDGCRSGIGVVLGPVSGATAYQVSYYDGYKKSVQTGSQPVKALLDGSPLPGKLWFGITGGSVSAGGCPSAPGDPTEGGRFSKGAKGWAIVPASFKPKPSLHVKVGVPSGGVSVNASVAVTVTVTAGELALKNVSLGRGLQVDGQLADVTTKPKGASGFSLGAGASKKFTYTVKAKAPGAATLSARASGTSKKGAVSGRDSATLRIAKAQLALTMAATPNNPRLEVNDDGTVAPTDITVTVRITNTGTTDVTGVSLQSLNPEPVTKGQRLDQIAFAPGTLPVDIGTVPAGTSVPKDFTLHVTGDGRYQIRALALYAAPDGGNGRISAVGGKFTATVPLLYFAPKRDDTNITYRGTDPWIQAGKTWYVNATIKNESSYQRLCVGPLNANPTQNAAATGPVDIAEKSIRETGGPYSGALGPGKSTVLQMFVDTATGGATASNVSFKPAAGKLDPGQHCDDKIYKGLTKLGPPDILVPEPGGDFTVHVDTTSPVSEEGLGSFTINFAGGFTKNIFVDTVKGVLDLGALARAGWTSELEYERQYPLAPPFAAQITIRSAQAIAVASDVYATYWKLASAQQKDGVFAKAGAVLSKASNDFYTNATGAVEDAAKPWMAKMEKAYATGDEATMGELWGEVAGSAAQQAVLGVFTKVLGAQMIADTGELEAMAARAEKGWQEGEAATALEAETDSATNVAKETVEPGTPLNELEKAGVWGIDSETDSALARISKKFKVLIGVRSRSPGTLAQLKKGSVFKHENLKPKNVNEIDIQWLGFREADADLVRFRSYTPEQIAAITDRVNAAPLTAAQRKAILKRLATRQGEVPKFLNKIESFSKKGEINVGFNYRQNGIEKATTRQIRKFKLESQAATATGEVPAGGVYYTPLQENLDLYGLRKRGVLPPNCQRALASVLCTVTGDVDGVYLTTLQGSALPPDKLVDIYDELAAAGWQHAETTTWISDQGEFYFGDKANILQDLEIGGQAMVEYAPDGVTRATYLNLKGSSLVGSEDYHLRVIGGYTDYTAVAGP